MAIESCAAAVPAESSGESRAGQPAACEPRVAADAASVRARATDLSARARSACETLQMRVLSRALPSPRRLRRLRSIDRGRRRRRNGMAWQSIAGPRPSALASPIAAARRRGGRAGYRQSGRGLARGSAMRRAPVSGSALLAARGRWDIRVERTRGDRRDHRSDDAIVALRNLRAQRRSGTVGPAAATARMSSPCSSGNSNRSLSRRILAHAQAIRAG